MLFDWISLVNFFHADTLPLTIDIEALEDAGGQTVVYHPVMLVHKKQFPFNKFNALGNLDDVIELEHVIIARIDITADARSS